MSTRIIDIVRPYVERDATAWDVLADHPRFRYSSVAQAMAKTRRRLGKTDGRVRSGRPLIIPTATRAAYKAAADRLGKKSANALIVEILGIVAQDDMFAAILDDAS